MSDSLVAEYLARTPRSAAMFERAAAALPGGSTRTTIFSAPYPPYMARGAGIRTWDLDGNEYRDFLGNYTSLILGHAHPEVVAAVEAVDVDDLAAAVIAKLGAMQAVPVA